jgi:hypothetical protein
MADRAVVAVLGWRFRDLTCFYGLFPRLVCIGSNNAFRLDALNRAIGTEINKGTLQLLAATLADKNHLPAVLRNLVVDYARAGGTKAVIEDTRWAHQLLSSSSDEFYVGVALTDLQRVCDGRDATLACGDIERALLLIGAEDSSDGVGLPPPTWFFASPCWRTPSPPGRRTQRDQLYIRRKREWTYDGERRLGMDELGDVIEQPVVGAPPPGPLAPLPTLAPAAPSLRGFADEDVKDDGECSSSLASP